MASWPKEKAKPPYESPILNNFVEFLSRRNLTLEYLDESQLKAVDGAICLALENGTSFRNAFRSILRRGIVNDSAWRMK